MKTDREKFIELMESFGLDIADYSYTPFGKKEKYRDIVLGEIGGDTFFRFDENGKFVCIEVEE